MESVDDFRARGAHIVQLLQALLGDIDTNDSFGQQYWVLYCAHVRKKVTSQGILE